MLFFTGDAREISFSPVAETEEDADFMADFAAAVGLATDRCLVVVPFSVIYKAGFPEGPFFDSEDFDLVWEEPFF